MTKRNDPTYIEYENGKRVALDLDDSPEWTEEMFKKAKRGKNALEKALGKENAQSLIKRKVGRPVSVAPKKQVTLRLDPDIVDEFRSHGKGWQTEINHVLRQWVEHRL